ncbi:hypothetical protein EDB84DRAFT_1469804, partial [Lactarius hengduanensis]
MLLLTINAICYSLLPVRLAHPALWPLCYFRELPFTTRDASDYPSDAMISLIPCLAPLATPSLAMLHDGRPAIAPSDAHPLHVHACTIFTH